LGQVLSAEIFEVTFHEAILASSGDYID